MRQQEAIGVIIGRFQVPALHAGHRYLIDTAKERHAEVLVLVGVHVGQPTERDPLNYELREELIAETYPTITTKAVFNKSSDSEWSKQVDRLVAEVANGREAVLYASRDSFASHYSGRYPIEELPELPGISGTKLRAEVSSADRTGTGRESFRCGVIYSVTKTRFPTTYPTVDVAILHTAKPLVLLGRKPGEDKWCFVGGFVDPTDRTLEAAVRREVREEVGDIEIDDFRYICSSRINDFRYRNSQDGITTTFFTASYIFGHIKAGDDLEELRWFNYDAIREALKESHQGLGTQLINHLNQVRK